MAADARGKRGPDALHTGKFLLARVHDLVNIAERTHERRTLALADALDLVEYGSKIALGVQAPELGDGEAVRFVTDALQRL